MTTIISRTKVSNIQTLIATVSKVSCCGVLYETACLLLYSTGNGNIGSKGPLLTHVVVNIGYSFWQLYLLSCVVSYCTHENMTKKLLSDKKTTAGVITNTDVCYFGNLAHFQITDIV